MRFIKKLEIFLIPLLQLLFNLPIEKCVIPIALKIGRITALHKKEA
jgi:hypothetical protein